TCKTHRSWVIAVGDLRVHFACDGEEGAILTLHFSVSPMILVKTQVIRRSLAKQDLGLLHRSRGRYQRRVPGSEGRCPRLCTQAVARRQGEHWSWKGPDFSVRETIGNEGRRFG